ncbi:arylamine N-acetyltransferase (plasmid) [Halorussus salilacus]|nr:arylamine N-acetyltransferase [Halorussus salilacus]
MDPDAYLERIGIDPGTVETPDLDTLERLQRAHVTAVPFENLSVVGDPHGDRDAEGDGERVVLSTPHLREKVVERGRGGYCFELNGLFHSLLAVFGYDVDRVAARVVGDDGDARPPANHHANIVELDRRYVVDVGMGVPTMRRPIPLDGTPRSDSVGVEWRIAESDRPDETYRSEYRGPGDVEWSTRYVFSDVAREFRYFEATNDYLQTAPESPFTGDPVVSVATDEGHRKLSGETLTEYVSGDERERTVTHEEWHATLEREFGLRYDRG